MSIRTYLLLLLPILTSLACGRRESGLPDSDPPEAPWKIVDRVVPVEGANGVVVSGHPLASNAGAQVLRRGGNAIDAAVAVGLALAVVAPDAGNLGGGGFLVYRDTDGKIETLDYRETAPGAATPDMYLDDEGNPTEASLVGHLAAGVPGSVAGLYEMHQRHGSLGWPAVVTPAIELARGHILDSARSFQLLASAEKLRRFRASRETFLVAGEPPGQGTHWEQPELAATLTLISERGADAFYRGRIAELIAAEMERGQGLITLEDLRAYRPVWRDPIEISYRGYTIYSMPPPSSGGVTLAQILNILEGFEKLPPAGSPELIHLQAEAMRRSFRDRNRHLGDPDFVAIPLDRLLSKDYAASLRSQIDPRRASSLPPSVNATPEGDHTTHYSVVDSQGRAAAITTTLNGLFGCGVTVAGAGFLLNNEMDDFTTAPNRPNQFGLIQGDVNSISPGRRMLSSMTPTIVVNPAGELEMVLGTRGGPRIISSVFQVVSNLIDQGMEVAEAVGAPRVHHQALPNEILYEPAGLSETQKTALRNMGHRLRRNSSTFGDVNTISKNGDSWIGIADPRRSGGAVAY